MYAWKVTDESMRGKNLMRRAFNGNLRLVINKKAEVATG